MVATDEPCAVIQERGLGCNRAVQITGQVSPQSNVCAGGEGVGVCGAEDTLAVDDEGLERCGCSNGVAGFALRLGEVGSRDQRVWVIRAQDPFPVNQKFGEDGHRSGMVAGGEAPSAQVTPDTERFWMFAAKDRDTLEQELFEGGGGGGGPARHTDLVGTVCPAG
jgi:hypothetical protein